jgi:hypothetical protein
MKPEELFEQLEPILGPKARKLYLAWLLAADKDEKQEIELCLNALYVKHLRPTPTPSKVLLAPPSQEASRGTIPVGTVLYNEQALYGFGLREAELCQHVAIFGRTGSGKTNAVRVLLMGLLARKIPALVFDWKKDYSQLDFEAVFAGIGIRNKDILVFPLGKRNVNCLKLNPLIPPRSTSPEVWVKQLCEILTHAYCGGPGFESIFLRAIDHCYAERGIYQGGTEYPTFLDVKQYLDGLRVSGRELQWMQSVNRTIQAICFGGMGDTVNGGPAANLAELLGKNVILELDALSNADKTFLIETVMLWLHHHRLDNPPAAKVDNVIILEEAHHLLRKHDSDEETLIENCLREMRSLGIGIIIVDQMPSLISGVALANTFVTIALNVKTGQDVNALSQAMLLDTEQKDMLGMLPVGQAIVKLQDRHIRPFHIAIPHMECGTRIVHYQPPADSGRIPGIPADSGTIRSALSSGSGVPPPMKPATPQRSQPPTFVPASVERPTAEALQVSRAPPHGPLEEQTQLLLDIATHPTQCVTTRYKRLGWSARKGNYVKDKLVRAGLITPVTFAGDNAWLRLFEITVEGARQLVAAGHALQAPQNGGLEHQYWKEKLAEHFRGHGYVVELEVPIDGHAVDLIARSGDECVAVEVETGKSNFRKNIERCLHGKHFTTVLAAGVTQAVASSIRSATSGLHDERLWVDDVRTILRSDPY